MNRTTARWAISLVLLGGSALAAPSYEWLSPAASAELPAASGSEALVDEARQLQDRLEALQREERERHALMVARGRAYVRLARAGLLPLAGGFEALAAHASKLERLRRAISRDVQRERQLTALRLETARALTDLQNLRPAERNAMARARSAVAAAEDRDRAFERAFNSDWNPVPSTAVYGGVVQPGATPPAAGFAALRGRLPFPIAGRTELRKLRSPSGAGHAVVISAAPGASVRAVYSGRVAFADEYPDLGRTVIIDHGAQFYTVSAHLQVISVRVGDELEAGERIGTVGGYDDKPGLLFEVRAGRGTVNTPEWFGI